MNKIIVSFLLLLLSLNLYSENTLEKYIIDRKTGSDGTEIIGVKVPGGRPPEGYVRKEIVDTESLKTSRSIVIIDDVPAFDWSYGCSATSAAIIAAYYDRNGYPNIYSGPTNAGVMPLNNSIWNNSSGGEGGDGECPLSATHQGFDGLTSRGHVDDYWVEYGSENQDPYLTNGWTPHTNADCTGDFMGTNQSSWSNTDGSTTFYTNSYGNPLYSFSDCESYNPPRKDGGYGFEQFMESRGYTVTTCYNQIIYGYEGLTQGFTFDQYKAEIDANRPVLIHVVGHTMVGFGYDSSDQTIYIKNTWDYSTHTMTWGEDYNDMTHYAVTVLNLDPNQSVQYGDTSNNPILVNSLPLSATGNTNDYTNTLGYSSKDVFYKLLLPVQADNVTINTNGSDYDTYLRFYNSFQNQTNADNNSGEGSCSQLTGLNLSANTAYYVCVEGYNSNNGNYSLNIFIPGYEYLTLECNDSYGDGWSNIQYTSDNLPNSISVLVNEEIVIQDFTFNDGAQATTTFGLFPGDTVTTSFNPGSWSEECSYRILDSNNIELASGDESTDISFVYRENAVLPSNLTATIVNNNDVTLQWGLGNRQSDQSVSKSPEKEFEDSELRALTGFKVYRNNNLIATLSSVYTYTDLNLANNTYQYKITALYGSEESQPSNLASVTINMGNPQIVENVEVLYYEDAILLAWDNVVLDTNNHSLTPDYYNIYASDTTDEENFIIIGTSNENFFSILIEEISFNPAFFKVTAVKEN